MRCAIIAIVAIPLLAAAATAEDRTLGLPPVVVDGGENGDGVKRCVDIESDEGKVFDCLNRRLDQEVRRMNPGMVVAPFSGRSPDVQIGVVNVPGVRQQYGANFGVSAAPFRPSAPVYAPLLGRH
jgi:hypothetical protein